MEQKAGDTVVGRIVYAARSRWSWSLKHFRKFICFVALAISAGCAATALRAAVTNYDGVWTIEGTTDVGPCQKTFGGEAKIQGNDLVSLSETNAQAAGAIDGKGVGWARLTRFDGQARATGRFRGATASGAWSSNTSYCGGRWTARRKG
jgi:hypothetical protein